MYLKQTKLEKLSQLYSDLQNSEFADFGEYLKHFYLYLSEDDLLKGFLAELSLEYPFEDSRIITLLTGREEYSRELFETRSEFYSSKWHSLQYLIKEHGFKIHHLGYYGSGGQKLVNIIGRLIKPIVSFLEEKLKDENSINYVLSRYKRRTEWFTRKNLYEKYNAPVNSQYEEVLDQDLKLYLFDMGLEYPISKPSSASGNADIVGNIDKKDAFILEIKIVDKGKKYGKNKVLAGIAQAYKYSVDYNKPYAHLVVFNFDEAEIVFNLSSSQSLLKINNKSIFFVTININHKKSASKIGKLPILEINEPEMFKYIEDDMK